ncbi:MAG: membrane protein insertion efficiency factor YidD [Deltaproteobacteria bacterium]|nr:membrane protein insertion efficiency factor YidD [Deltaproteobacteria bacterium]
MTRSRDVSWAGHGELERSKRWVRTLCAVGLLPSRALVAILLALVAFYRKVVSPGLSPRCRFSPSCSAYAAESLQRYGLVRGLCKAGWRLCRCHPWGGAGYDPP